MNQDNQTKRIEAYSIADFVKQIQEAVLEGYKTNLEDNEKYPLQIGVGFYATLDKNSVLSPEDFKTMDEDINTLQKFVAGIPSPYKDIVTEVEREAIICDAVKAIEQPAKRGRQPKV